MPYTHSKFSLKSSLLPSIRLHSKLQIFFKTKIIFAECPRSQIRWIPLRKGGRLGHDLCPAILHRVRQRPEQREAVQPLAELHSRLLSSGRQLAWTVAAARHSGIQKGLCRYYDNFVFIYWLFSILKFNLCFKQISLLSYFKYMLTKKFQFPLTAGTTTSIE